MKAINILLVIVFSATLLACEVDPNAPISLTLCQKDEAIFPEETVPYTPTECLAGGTNGDVTYIPAGVQFNYWLNARVPLAETAYRPIYYPDVWPGTGLVCLTEDPLTSDAEGMIIHQECIETNGSLPTESDANHCDNVDEGDPCGAKIWLVLADDVDCDAQVMVAWNADDYLFETRLIEYTDQGNSGP